MPTPVATQATGPAPTAVDPPPVAWTRYLESSAEAQPYGLAADATGIYVAGDVFGTLPGQTSEGLNDAFLLKFDASGNVLWTSQFGSSAADVATAIAADATGVYVAGWTEGAFPGQTNADSYDVFLRKYDATGNVLWTHEFGTSEPDWAHALATDATGVYIAGGVGGTLPEQTSAGQNDAFLRKYDANGTELWTRQFGTLDSEEAHALTIDSTGVYVAGITLGALPGQTNAGLSDAFLRKYDAGGEELWTRQFGTLGYDDPSALGVGGLGVCVAGYVGGALPNQTSAGEGDAFLLMYDPGGNEIWTRQFGTAGDDAATALVADATGVYLAGGAGGTLPGQGGAEVGGAFLRNYDTRGNELWTLQFGDPDSGGARALAVDPPGLYVAGRDYVRKYDLGWRAQWTRQFGESSDDSAYALAKDAEGIYVAGYTWGTLPGQTSAGGEDAFLRRYDAGGTELWTRQFGTQGYDSARALTADGMGVYTAGYVGGALPGQTNGGSGDAFLRRYDGNGTELWTRQFGTSDPDEARALTADATGVYVAGWTGSEWTVAFLRKYDANGTELWTRQFETSDYTIAAALAADATGVYVAGTTESGVTRPHDTDAFLRKYDRNGTVLWTRQFGVPEGDSDSASALATDATGVYVAGIAPGAYPGQTNAGESDAFVRKYDAGGNELWTRQFGTPGFEDASALAIDATGVYIAGITTGILPGQTYSGYSDAFVRKYDAGGNELWTRQFGTPDYDYAYALAADATGVYVAGRTHGTLPGQTSAGHYDVFVGQPWIGPPALLRVITNPSVPAKIFVDGIARDEWGLGLRVALGTHTISLGGLNGLVPPSPFTVTLAAGWATTVQADFAISGYLRVATNPPVPSTIYVNGRARDDWGLWTAMPPGTYSVQFGAVAGYDSPADESANVVAGQTTTVTGNFTPNPNAQGPDPSTYGMLRVKTNPALAVQIFVNGIPMDDWGLAGVKLAPGMYTVSFGDVYGAAPPAPSVVTVTAGHTTTYNAAFRVHGSLRVMTSPAVPATIYVNGLPRDDWGMWQSMPPGTYTVSFGYVPGYKTPASQTVTMTAGALTTVTGGYVEMALATQPSGPVVSSAMATVLAIAVPQARPARDDT